VTDARAVARERRAAALDAEDPRLQPPLIRPDVVWRERLVNELVAPRPENVVAVVAPAGYGKTTLLAQWRAREVRPVAWVSLTAADADSRVLLGAIIRSLDAAIGLPSAVLDLLDSSASVLSTVVPRLAWALRERGQPCLLILDDLQHIADTPSIDAVGLLIAYLPQPVVLAFGGRNDAGLPMPRLRALGRLAVLSETELALDEAEGLDAVRRIAPRCSVADARAIQDRTEGWPAALYLMARDHRRQADLVASDHRETATRSNRDLSAFLDEELITRHDAATRSFLMQTAILDRLSGPLCDAVTGRSRSGDRLLRLADDDHLIVALDGEDRWFRYHALLREHLVRRLESGSHDVAELHRRAARWYDEQGAHVEAIEHLFAAGDTDAAAERITRQAFRTFRKGGTETVERWVDRLDDATVRRHPAVAAIAAMISIIEGRVRAAERLASLVEDADPATITPLGSFQVARATIRALRAPEGVRTARADARLAVDGGREDDPWRPIALVTLGILHEIDGERASAEDLLRRAETVADAQEADRALVVALAARSLSAADQDEWGRASALAGRAVAITERLGDRHDITGAYASAAAARVAIRRGDIQAARRLLADFKAASPATTVAAPWLSVRILLVAAANHLALSDTAGARTVLTQAEDIVAQCPGLGRLADDLEVMRRRIRSMPPGPGGASTLTPSELRVLRFLPTYLSVPEIAERLVVSSATVRTQVQSIYGKLGATSRRQAIEAAVEYGLLEPHAALLPDDFTIP
jgi:LuxR family maltose regulon positive regulatory protein